MPLIHWNRSSTAFVGSGSKERTVLLTRNDSRKGARWTTKGGLERDTSIAVDGVHPANRVARRAGGRPVRPRYLPRADPVGRERTTGRQEGDHAGTHPRGRKHPRRLLRAGDGREHDPEEAQSEAAERIELLRWGDEGKDYFWITDMHPTMIMHPYLPELNGQDLTNYEDQRGQEAVRRLCGSWSGERFRVRGLLLAMERRPQPHRPQAVIRRALRTLAVGDRHRHLRRRRQCGHRAVPAQLDLHLTRHHRRHRPASPLRCPSEHEYREERRAWPSRHSRNRTRSTRRWPRQPPRASS